MSRKSGAETHMEVSEVTARLTQQFPELSAEQIERAVHGEEIQSQMTLSAYRRSSAEEQKHINQVTARLADQFPELSAEEIHSAVHGEYARFDDAAIRDFVPILVERTSREALKRYRA
jgi:uncharacterized protein (DUF433 family)